MTVTQLSEIRPPAVGEICVWTVPLEAPTPTARRLQANAALRRVLAGCLGISADALRFAEHPAGKPKLAGDELEFNLTHSGAWTMIAVSLDTPVGIDLERPRRFSSVERLERLVQRICSPAEQAAVAAADDPTDFLLRLWVRKEAVVKAEGTGVGAGERLPQLDVLGERTSDYTVTDLESPQPGYHAALAHLSDHGSTRSATTRKPAEVSLGERQRRLSEQMAALEGTARRHGGNASRELKANRLR